MSVRAREFVDQWVQENINPTGYVPEGDRKLAKEMWMKCLHEADLAGIGRREIMEEFGHSEDHMASEIERINDEEVQRQIGKDKS